MNQNKNQGGKRAVISFVVSILMALVCFGVFVLVYMSTKGPTPVDDRIVEIQSRWDGWKSCNAWRSYNT